MAIVKHKFIQHRSDFFDVLDGLIAQTQRLRSGAPWAPLDVLQRQLDAMKTWTSGGRAPTKTERRSITIALISMRELEPAANDEIYDYSQRLTEISFYFKLWRDDAAWAAMDDDDRSIAFPDD